MTSHSTRRTILAGAAALSALAIPASAATVIADPIFAAILKHEAAFQRSQELGAIYSETEDAAHDFRPRQVKYNLAMRASDRAANALTTIQPTTLAGVIALFKYVERFNAQGVALESDPDGWSSSPMFWPAKVDNDEIDLFGYALMANARRALEALAVQS